MNSALFSECGNYRYLLTRTLSTPIRWVKPALFIMLNPSTADAIHIDPTIRRCIGFATKWGSTDLTILNLFAFRSTDPKKLLKCEDPIGPKNDLIILREVNNIRNKNGIIVVAWGAQKIAEERGKDLINKIGEVECLGYTKSGAPRHPLYVSCDTERIIYESR